jgi:FkbM family methyltransferase
MAPDMTLIGLPNRLLGKQDNVGRFFQFIYGLARQIAHARQVTPGWRSFLRLAGDLALSRLIPYVRLPNANGARRIRVHGGIEIAYRLNRGDIQSIREVWLDEAYKLPINQKPKIIVDLGANIGLTSLWLAKRYGCDKIIAVEPWVENARMARHNLASNGVCAEVIEAAVGPTDGRVLFSEARDSNMGRTGFGDRTVQMVSMFSVLGRLPSPGCVDLVKMDIEGAEQELLTGDLTWLRKVKSLIIEFHPTLVDYPSLVNRLRECGFDYIPAGTAHPDSMDFFVQRDADDTGQTWHPQVAA